MYNLTNLYLQNESVGMITELNTLSDGWLIGWLLIVLYVVLLFTYQRGSLRKTSIVVSAITSFITIYLFVIGWIGLNIVILSMVMMFIYIFIVLFGSE